MIWHANAIIENMRKINHLRNFEQHNAVLRILQFALEAAEPAGLVQRCVHLEGSLLSVSGRAYDLAAFEHVYLLSIGKAGWTLAQALDDLIGGFLSRGLVITTTATPRRSTGAVCPAVPQAGCAGGARENAGQTQPRSFEVIEAGHPIPDGRSLRAGQAVLDFLREVGPDDLLICAISGGGSSLMTVPHSPIELVDLQALTSRLLACGATIHEINVLRRHLDLLKGGGLLRHTQATVLGLILSDVPGNALADIASGPTAPDPTTRSDALAILRKYNLFADCPAHVLSTIESAAETLKPQDTRLENVQNVVIGSNLLAIQAALKQAAVEGFHPYLLRADLAGEAREAARELCQSLHGEPVARPFCMVAGGETTVTVYGEGRGGRNTELALAAVTELADFPEVLLVTLATDGKDGPTDAAGAVVTGESWRRAQALGLHPVEYLKRNDSYSFFAALDDLITTGPSGTNVNDLVLLFGF